MDLPASSQNLEHVWLGNRKLVLQDYLVMERDGELSLRDIWKKPDKEREASRVAELNAFKACPFQLGFKFASNGMLCDVPPIPIRTLDFLEAQDLVNLSRVCKATHQAAHFLLEREVWAIPQLTYIHGALWNSAPGPPGWG